MIFALILIVFHHHRNKNKFKLKPDIESIFLFSQEIMTANHVEEQNFVEVLEVRKDYSACWLDIKKNALNTYPLVLEDSGSVLTIPSQTHSNDNYSVLRYERPVDVLFVQQVLGQNVNQTTLQLATQEFLL